MHHDQAQEICVPLGVFISVNSDEVLTSQMRLACPPPLKINTKYLHHFAARINTTEFLSFGRSMRYPPSRKLPDR
ncbi:hypothetical protein EVAR_39279_1 [Eumeta japonica]|uniref:Uncharacterized protein n=1 Tax=Eumeta variegata TaxID=151549 RepID=A0A4C1VY04_EUMVA|nr:hypothetical protein EVAR_39279_1 [Eumeta japonica]